MAGGLNGRRSNGELECWSDVAQARSQFNTPLLQNSITLPLTLQIHDKCVRGSRLMWQKLDFDWHDRDAPKAKADICLAGRSHSTAGHPVGRGGHLGAADRSRSGGAASPLTNQSRG